MSVTSCGRALAVSAPRGRPRPSMRTMIFVPLPRIVLPTFSPLFLLRQTCRRPSTLRGPLGHVGRVFATTGPRFFPSPSCGPLLEPTPISCDRLEPLRKILPPRAAAKHSNDALDAGTRCDHRASALRASGGFGKQVFDQMPLLVRDLKIRFRLGHLRTTRKPRKPNFKTRCAASMISVIRRTTEGRVVTTIHTECRLFDTVQMPRLDLAAPLRWQCGLAIGTAGTHPSDFKNTAPSGGSVKVRECIRPKQGTGDDSTPPRFP